MQTLQAETTMNIHKKINMKANLILHFSFAQARQMIENNKIALAPYYMAKLKRQNDYVNERNNTPQWAKELEGYLH